MNYQQYLRVAKFLPRLIYKRNGLPNYFVFFITHRCVAYCDHCFDWERRKNTKQEDELAIKEIEKISKSMDDILFMFLTGGEPFIREDISEIAKIFYKNNRVMKFQIPSNGWFTDSIVRNLKEIAETCPNVHVSTTISIDSLGQKHDKIRHLEGLFDNAISTIKEVKKLENHFPNIGLNVEITVSKNNQADLIDTYNYLTRKIGVSNVFFPLIRGKPRKEGMKDVNMDFYEELIKKSDIDVWRKTSKGYRGFPFARVVTWKNVIQQKLIANIKRNNRSVIPCVAGRDYGILYANGDVFPCEMLKMSLGNVKDYGYDFKKLWLEKNNRAMVKKKIIKSKCFCTHECAISASLLLNPRYLLKIIVNGIANDVLYNARYRL